MIAKSDSSPLSATVAVWCMAAMGLFVVLSPACQAKSDRPPQPVEVHLGEDLCAACGMIISDDHFGAQAHQDQNAAALFDDLGCLLKSSSSEKSVNSIFVRSFEDSSWIPAERAFAVVSSQIHSPMGYGMATFATEQAAEAYAARFQGATVHEIDSLLKNPIQK